MKNSENSEIEKEKVVLVEEYRKSLRAKIKRAEGRKGLKIIDNLIKIFLALGLVIAILSFFLLLGKDSFALAKIIIIFLIGAFIFFLSVILSLVFHLIVFLGIKKINKKIFSSEELSKFLEEKKEKIKKEIEKTNSDIDLEIAWEENIKKEKKEELICLEKRRKEQSSYLQKLEEITF